MRLKPAIDFILFSNLFVAFSFSCLAFQTFLITGSRVDFSLILFIFCSSFLTYSFHRWFKIKKSMENPHLPYHLDWIKTHKKQMVMIFMLMAPIIIFSSFKLSFSHVIALIPLGIISLGYTIPVIREGDKNIGLREIPGLKIFLIAFVISCVTILLPVVSLRVETALNDSEIFYLFIERFLFVFAITIPFDIRDMQYDKLNMTKTIPVMMGEKNAKMISCFALVLCLVTGVFHFFSGEIKLMTGAALALSLLIASVVIFKSSQNRSEYYFYFLVESMMVVQTLLVVLFNLIIILQTG